MKTKSKTKIKKLYFADPQMMDYISIGTSHDNTIQFMIKEAMAVIKLKVEAKRHTIISGAKGIGKSVTAARVLQASGKPYVLLSPGMSDFALAYSIAYGVYHLKPQQELIVLLDDADDLIFYNKETMNRWKTALNKPNAMIGHLPTYDYIVAVDSLINGYHKNGRVKEASVLEKFRSEDQLGLQIPTDRCRFIVLCNTDWETVQLPKRMRADVDPVLSRFKAKSIKLTGKEIWGWAASVLERTQPFEDQGVVLSTTHKQTLLEFLYENLDRLPSQLSYRDIEEFAAEMINFPNQYRQLWRGRLKTEEAA